MSESLNSPDNRGEGSSIARGEFLGDGPKLKDDMRLITRAARLGWGVPAKIKAEAVERLHQIASKTTVSMPAGETGVVDAEFPADQNAIAAIRTLATLDGLDQTDHWNQDKNARLDAGQLTERVGVGEVISRRPIATDVKDPTLDSKDAISGSSV